MRSRDRSSSHRPGRSAQTSPAESAVGEQLDEDVVAALRRHLADEPGDFGGREDGPVALNDRGQGDPLGHVPTARWP
jgi:hypothetical protein